MLCLYLFDVNLLSASVFVLLHPFLLRTNSWSVYDKLRCSRHACVYCVCVCAWMCCMHKINLLHVWMCCVCVCMCECMCIFCVCVPCVYVYMSVTCVSCVSLCSYVCVNLYKNVNTQPHPIPLKVGNQCAWWQTEISPLCSSLFCDCACMCVVWAWSEHVHGTVEHIL